MIAYLLPVMATRLYHIASLKILEATSSPCGISPCNIIQYSRLSVYFLVGIGISIIFCKSKNYKYILLSYNNEGVMPQNDIQNMGKL